MNATAADIERTILSVLRPLLQRDDIGVSESFFDLGADSLLLVEARTQLSAALGRNLTDVDLFTYPNIASLVQYLTEPPDSSATTEGARRAQQRLARLAARRDPAVRP